MTDTFKDRAVRVINGVFGGQHHVFGLKWENMQGADFSRCSFTVGTGLATYDYAEMTRLVVFCHEECVRGEIGNGGPNRLRIRLSNRARKHKHPDMCAHPTLEQHLEQIRRGGSYQPLFDQLRADPVKP